NSHCGDPDYRLIQKSALFLVGQGAGENKAPNFL
ncbi:unnamed protein product, partial [marine sediment metagenome]